HGSGGDPARRSTGSAVRGSRDRRRRDRPAARAACRVRRHGAAHHCRVAAGLPPRRNRLPSRPDRHTVRVRSAPRHRASLPPRVIAFLQPLWLLGLSAAAIPALLHLRQRQTPPTIVFPAVRYLQETKKEHSRRLKLRNLLLLILRTLI